MRSLLWYLFLTAACAKRPANLRSRNLLLPAAQFSGLLTAPLPRKSRFATLEREYDVEFGYSHEEVDATAADSRTAELFAVPKREPLLPIREVYSTKGAVIVWVLGLYRSDRHNLVIRRFR